MLLFSSDSFFTFSSIGKANTAQKLIIKIFAKKSCLTAKAVLPENLSTSALAFKSLYPSSMFDL
ncbi:MAG: hypothetical protein H7296_07765 [Bacteroidia bacterium]|nr:hypothetical protein [Bacteroidia bacterium]